MFKTLGAVLLAGTLAAYGLSIFGSESYGDTESTMLAGDRYARIVFVHDTPAD